MVPDPREGVDCLFGYLAKVFWRIPQAFRQGRPISKWNSPSGMVTSSRKTDLTSRSSFSTSSNCAMGITSLLDHQVGVELDGVAMLSINGEVASTHSRSSASSASDASGSRYTVQDTAPYPGRTSSEMLRNPGGRGRFDRHYDGPANLRTEVDGESCLAVGQLVRFRIERHRRFYALYFRDYWSAEDRL